MDRLGMTGGTIGDGGGTIGDGSGTPRTVPNRSLVSLLKTSLVHTSFCNCRFLYAIHFQKQLDRLIIISYTMANDY